MRTDPFEARARELCQAAGLDPDARVSHASHARGMPAWCQYRNQARQEATALAAAALTPTLPMQDPEYADAPYLIVGDHEPTTVTQLENCMRVGNTVAGALCADGHLGYAQPVGGVVAYEEQVSISGVGFDIGCGNMAVRLNVPYDAVASRRAELAKAIAQAVSFGVGRTNGERVEHALFDDTAAWDVAGLKPFMKKARAQLGTVGSGNHYVDLFEDEAGWVWIGVHFGSRGLGHTAATQYLKLAGGRDGMHVPPTVVNVNTELGARYLGAMELAGRYAYAGREWVVERVRQLVGGHVTQVVHNHHNYAWQERHHDRNVWVVRKGATPAFPGQLGFVGGSMGDDAVILEGVQHSQAVELLHSTVHGAGRLFGRKEAKRRFTQAEWHAWLDAKGVTVLGGGLDESPMAYRRLPEVLAYHQPSVRVVHTLRPFVVVMAGEGEHDPYKD